jgi:hypothetical protein
MARSGLAATLTLLAVTAGCARGTPEAPAPREAAAPASARELVTRMREHWDGRFYRTLVFLQNNTRYTTTGEEEKSQWREWQQVPGRLRIQFLPAATRSGMLFRDDTLREFGNGELARTAPQVHPLLLLSADVYALPVDRSVRALDSLHIDTTLVRADSWRGRPAWVVGAAPGDSASSQFWVDADSLLVRRIIQRVSAPTGRVLSTEFHFTYQTVDGFAVPREIVFLRDGKPFWKEEYVEARVNVPLPDGAFDPARWTDPPELP